MRLRREDLVIREGRLGTQGDPILCGRWLELMVPVEPRPEFRWVWQRRNRERETRETETENERKGSLRE
jgi:hypothetical protein